MFSETESSYSSYSRFIDRAQNMVDAMSDLTRLDNQAGRQALAPRGAHVFHSSLLGAAPAKYFASPLLPTPDPTLSRAP